MVFLKHIFSGVFIHLAVIAYTQAISLDNSGYYKIVVAIDERTVQNTVPNYVENIKMGIQDLSDLLHHSTQGKFSISEADILVPDHWNVTTNGSATSQSYTGADIKISHVFSLPYVNNHNPCGFPGIDVQLPYNFFDDGDEGSYGRLGKALLVQFARLRFGVWEEHGYPGDSLFPYYWKPLMGATEWQVNACTDQPIHGVYKNINDGSPCGPDPEDTDHLYPPPSDCRFYPNYTPQQAKSSIMSYHYLPTIESFCADETHDISKPTPQNYYCRYKSVMQVIEESFDWKQTLQPNTAKRVTFNVVKNSPTPLLYILLDSGITNVNYEVLSQISNHLTTFISSSALRNIFVGVGKFPGDESSSTYSEVVPWSLVKENVSLFITAFETTFDTDSGFKNYGGAIKDLINLLNKRKHVPGCAILVVKTSPEPNAANLTPESDILMAALLADVKIFAIEVHGSPIQSVDALRRISLKSEGSHLAVRNADDLMLVEEFMHNLTTVLQSPITSSNKYFLSVKEIVGKDAPVSLKMASKITQFEAFVIPLTGSIDCCPKFLRGTEGNFDDVVFEPIPYWDSNVVAQKSYYHSSDLLETPTDNLNWQTVSYICSSCTVLVVIVSQVEDASMVPQDIQLTVTTSAINNVVDLAVANAGTAIGAPFAIYAKLEQDGVPFEATEGFVVTAVIKSPSKVWTLELKDEGNAAPDVTVNDGIFSAPFVTDENGLHEIFVTAIYRKPSERHVKRGLTNSKLSRSAGKLFPIDQASVGCGNGYLGCWSKIPDQDFVATSEIDGSVEFINLNQFLPLPNRIMDLVITPLGENKLNLQWTDPGALMSPPKTFAQCDYYEIKHLDRFEGLLYGFDIGENLPANYLPYPRTPGSRQNITYDFGREADRYYAIRSGIVVGASIEWSEISIIVGVNIRSELITTTTTTTTTIRPTTSSTLPPPTTQPGPSTTEEDFTTTPPTTPRTTRKRSTTVRPTTPPTTTKLTTTARSTTTEKPTKHWFATTEGIVTISVFGSGVLLLTSGSLVYLWLIRFRS